LDSSEEYERFISNLVRENLPLITKTGTNHLTAEMAIRNRYKFHGLEPLPIEWARSPRELTYKYVDSLFEGLTVGSVSPTYGRLMSRNIARLTSFKSKDGDNLLDNLKKKHIRTLEFSPIPANVRSMLASIESASRFVVSGLMLTVQTEIYSNLISRYLEAQIQIHVGFKPSQEFFMFKKMIENVTTVVWTHRSVILCERPVELHYEEFSGDLGSLYLVHNKTGPAIRYSNGEETYVVRGRTVPKEFLEKPPRPEDVLKEPDTEMRNAMIELIGIENLVQYGKVMDSDDIEPFGPCVLYDMKNLFNQFHSCPYLKMTNPSTGEVHFEGVSPECTTVRQAHNWRAGNIKVDWTPAQLS